MILSARMAWRYLFASKSTNAINIITLIAGFGVAIGTMALILVLSVFNGFEELFLGFFDNLNPDARVVPARGKTFAVDDEMIADLRSFTGVRAVSRTLEETAMFSYAGRQTVGRIKGVDSLYLTINGIDSLVREGEYRLYPERGTDYGAVVGNQLSLSLGIDHLNQFEPLVVYMARPRARGSAAGSALTGRSTMVRRQFQPTGVVQSLETFGTQPVLVPLSEAQDLLSQPDSVVSALEIGLEPASDAEAVIVALREHLGEDFRVLDRQQQQSSLLKIMQIEKWVGFALVCLMMVLISFNLIGALWMIVLEKRQDVSILRSLGMTTANIRGIFLRVGVVVCLIGIAVGFVLAITAAVLQQEFSLYRVGDALSEPYPMKLRLLNFPLVALVVTAIGTLASYLPARYAARLPAIVTEE